MAILNFDSVASLNTQLAAAQAGDIVIGAAGTYNITKTVIPARVQFRGVGHNTIFTPQASHFWFNRGLKYRDENNTGGTIVGKGWDGSIIKFGHTSAGMTNQANDANRIDYDYDVNDYSGDFQVNMLAKQGYNGVEVVNAKNINVKNVYVKDSANAGFFIGGVTKGTFDNLKTYDCSTILQYCDSWNGNNCNNWKTYAGVGVAIMALDETVIKNCYFEEIENYNLNVGNQGSYTYGGGGNIKSAGPMDESYESEPLRYFTRVSFINNTYIAPPSNQWNPGVGNFNTELVENKLTEVVFDGNHYTCGESIVHNQGGQFYGPLPGYSFSFKYINNEWFNVLPFNNGYNLELFGYSHVQIINNFLKSPGDFTHIMGTDGRLGLKGIIDHNYFYNCSLNNSLVNSFITMNGESVLDILNNTFDSTFATRAIYSAWSYQHTVNVWNNILIHRDSNPPSTVFSNYLMLWADVSGKTNPPVASYGTIDVRNNIAWGSRLTSSVWTAKQGGNAGSFSITSQNNQIVDPLLVTDGEFDEPLNLSSNSPAINGAAAFTYPSWATIAPTSGARDIGAHQYGAIRVIPIGSGSSGTSTISALVINSVTVTSATTAVLNASVTGVGELSVEVKVNGMPTYQTFVSISATNGTNVINLPIPYNNPNDGLLIGNYPKYVFRLKSSTGVVSNELIKYIWEPLTVSVVPGQTNGTATLSFTAQVHPNDLGLISFLPQYNQAGGVWSNLQTILGTTGVGVDGNYTYTLQLVDLPAGTVNFRVLTRFDSALEIDTDNGSIVTSTTVNISGTGVNVSNLSITGATETVTFNATTSSSVSGAIQISKNAGPWETIKNITIVSGNNSHSISSEFPPQTYNSKSVSGTFLVRIVSGSYTSSSVVMPGSMYVPLIPTLTFGTSTSNSINPILNISDYSIADQQIHEYKIQYRVFGSSNWTNYTTLTSSNFANSVSSFTITGVLASTTYQVRVVTYYEPQGINIETQHNPGSIATESTTGNIDLTIDTCPNVLSFQATGYNGQLGTVYRKINGDSTFTSVKNITFTGNVQTETLSAINRFGCITYKLSVGQDEAFSPEVHCLSSYVPVLEIVSKTGNSISGKIPAPITSSDRSYLRYVIQYALTGTNIWTSLTPILGSSNVSTHDFSIGNLTPDTEYTIKVQITTSYPGVCSQASYINIPIDVTTSQICNSDFEITSVSTCDSQSNVLVSYSYTNLESGNYQILLDGTLYPINTDNAQTSTGTFKVIGQGQIHSVQLQKIDDLSCVTPIATVNIPSCSATCTVSIFPTSILTASKNTYIQPIVVNWANINLPNKLEIYINSNKYVFDVTDRNANNRLFNISLPADGGDRIIYAKFLNNSSCQSTSTIVKAPLYEQGSSLEISSLSVSNCGENAGVGKFKVTYTVNWNFYTEGNFVVYINNLVQKTVTITGNSGSITDSFELVCSSNLYDFVVSNVSKTVQSVSHILSIQDSCRLTLTSFTRENKCNEGYTLITAVVSYTKASGNKLQAILMDNAGSETGTLLNESTVIAGSNGTQTLVFTIPCTTVASVKYLKYQIVNVGS